jgi:hypothetical protein
MRPRVAIYSAQIYSLLICILTDPAESSLRYKAEYSASFVLVILAQDQGTRIVYSNARHCFREN